MIDLNCGIYQIANLVNEMRYVGQAQDVEDRWDTHLRALRKGNHPNSHLQAAWNLYGEDAFEFQLIEPCSKEQLDEREQFWIDSFDFDALYNISKYANSPMRGRKFSPETRAKIAESRRGKTLSAETRAKIAESRRSKTHSAETRAKIAESRRRTFSPEARAKIAESNRRRTISAETRAKIAESNRRRTISAETRAKIAESQRGKTHSAETRAKIAESRRSKTHSAETRSKMSASQKAQWALRAGSNCTQPTDRL